MSTPFEIENFNIPPKSATEIRQSFIDFFVSKDHTIVPSAPVVIHDDPTIMFTNSGMNQFKSLFLGDNPKGWKRVVNSQKCLRVSGKHNDLDEVGKDGTHHTFFEMLGNWSFADFYKKEIIPWAWELLTEVWKLPKDRLFVTVYEKDQESRKLWEELTDIDPWRILDFDDKDNFWEMGAVGPCGPCTEIHFDRGALATQKETYNHKVDGVNGENERFMEIWNLVFMQNERRLDGSIENLGAKHIDTGCGFERVVSIVQNKDSNYETDVFQPLIKKIVEISGVPYGEGKDRIPHQVVADHMRALVFSIADGVTPGNEGRGYVIRRILRRASRFARTLGQKEPFLARLVDTVAEEMKSAYPEVEERRSYITQVIQSEEVRFLKTLDQGLSKIETLAAKAKKKKQTEVEGSEVFLLHDTFGFPKDLTEQILQEHGLKVDHEGFEACMLEQKERARKAAKFDGSWNSDDAWTIKKQEKTTEFSGYESLTADANVLRYLEEGDSIYVVLDKTPFYAESGGQVGDQGTLSNDDVRLKVEDTFKVLDMWVHRTSLLHGLVNEKSMGKFSASVDADTRLRTRRNHSATHLLHSALRTLLGEHVTQQGSYVSGDKIRFDFTHHQGVTKKELGQIERWVNHHIQENYEVSTELKDLEKAKADGAIALFGEKYSEKVRVLTMGSVSSELCGGTHVERTGDIGLFKLVGESSIAAGIRRIEATAGAPALEMVLRQEEQLSDAADLVGAKPIHLKEKLEGILARNKELERQLAAQVEKELSAQVSGLIKEKTTSTKDYKLLVAPLKFPGLHKDHLQRILDLTCASLNDGVAVLTYKDEDSLSILAAVGSGLKGKFHAGNLVKKLGELADGRGGGRPEKARAGSKFPEKEGDVLAAAADVVGTLHTP